MCPRCTLSPGVRKAVNAQDPKRYIIVKASLEYFLWNKLIFLLLNTDYNVETIHVSCVIHDMKVWVVCARISIDASLAGNRLTHSLNFLFCFSDCDNVRFKASSYAALHRGRPPERPLNCKNPPHLGTSDFTQGFTVSMRQDGQMDVLGFVTHTLCSGAA